MKARRVAALLCRCVRRSRCRTCTFRVVYYRCAASCPFFVSVATGNACDAFRWWGGIILLLLSLGRSSFCSWAKQELILRSPITPFTSVVEPPTRVFRVELPPENLHEKSLPFLKQVCRIVKVQIVEIESTVRKMPEKNTFFKWNFFGVSYQQRASGVEKHLMFLHFLTLGSSIPG